MALTHAERNRLYRQRHPDRIREQNRRTKERAHGAEWLEPRFLAIRGIAEAGSVAGDEDRILTVAQFDVHAGANHPVPLPRTEDFIRQLMALRLEVRDSKPAGTVTRWVMYDADATWSLWLRDLPREDLVRLHACEKVQYLFAGGVSSVMSKPDKGARNIVTSRQVTLRWLRHRRLSITEMVRGRAYPMVIEDIGSWWQFKPLDQVLETESCASVAELAASLDRRLRAVGVPVRSYFGPGPAAESMLRRFHARDETSLSVPMVCDPASRTNDTSTNPVRVRSDQPVGTCQTDGSASYALDTTIPAQANFGGRIQLLQVGKFPRLYAYDLNSAYCWALSLAPSIKGWEWLRQPWRFAAGGTLHPFGVYRVRWAIPPSSYTGNHGICPFPQRIGDGIRWLSSGEGWFHACEIQAVLDNRETLAHVRKGGGANLSGSGLRESVHVRPSEPFIEVVEGYEPSAASISSPAFPWGRLAYELRRQESLLKVPLAALYGKLAETGGKFYSPYHAGWITARVRAEMLRAACLNAPAVVEIATDCLRSTEPLPLAAGDGLGEWKVSRETNCIMLQPGVSTSDQKRRQRGLEGDYIPWDEVGRQIGRRNQIDVTAHVPTFIGIGEAIHFDRWEDFGKTITIDYPLRVDPGLADPRGETFGSFRPDPAGPVSGVKRGLPWAREDVEAWL